jgi:hypothetical protein
MHEHGSIAGRCSGDRAVVSPNTIGWTFENTEANAMPSASSRNGYRLFAYRGRGDQNSLATMRAAASGSRRPAPSWPMAGLMV